MNEARPRQALFPMSTCTFMAIRPASEARARGDGASPRLSMLTTFIGAVRTPAIADMLSRASRGVSLYFMYGVALPDPNRLLLGSGNQGRFVRLESAAMLDRPEIEALVTAAIKESDTPLPRSGRGRLVIKSVSPKQRARRTARQ